MPSSEVALILDTAARLGIPAPVYAPHVRPGLFACWADRVMQADAKSIGGLTTPAMIAECQRYDGRGMPRVNSPEMHAAERRRAAELRAWNLAPQGTRRIDAGHCELRIERDGAWMWVPLLEMTDAELSARPVRRAQPAVQRAA